MRTRIQLAPVLSSDSRELGDLGNGEAEVVVDSQLEGGAVKFSVPPSTTDMAIQLTQISTAKFLFIKGQTRDPNAVLPTISLKINSTSNTPIDMAPLTTSKQSFFLLTAAGITSLFATNADATVLVDLFVMMVGDP